MLKRLKKSQSMRWCSKTDGANTANVVLYAHPLQAFMSLKPSGAAGTRCDGEEADQPSPPSGDHCGDDRPFASIQPSPHLGAAQLLRTHGDRTVG